LIWSNEVDDSLKNYGDYVEKTFTATEKPIVEFLKLEVALQLKLYIEMKVI
jgi:hypothetical protein